MVKIFDRQRRVQNAWHVRDLSLPIRSDVEGHTEIVGKVLPPVAAVAFSPETGLRVSIGMQHAVPESIPQRGSGRIVFRLTTDNHLKQGRYRFVKFRFVINSEMTNIRDG